MAGELPTELKHSVKTESRETAMRVAEAFIEDDEIVAVYPAGAIYGDEWCVQVLEWD